VVLPWPQFPHGLTLDGADLDDQLQRNDGEATRVRRAITCTCVGHGGRQDPTCQLCTGFGWRYPEDLEIADLMVQWVAPSPRHQIIPGGSHDGADYTCTWPSTQPLGIGDVFVHPHEEGVTDEALRRGTTAPGGATLERLRYHYPTTIEDLRDSTRAYTRGTHFDLGQDGRTILWVQGQPQPATGAAYTARYRYKSEYVIFKEPAKARHDVASVLPFTARVTRLVSLGRQQGAQQGEGVEP
jgi:hypothetical protein